MLQRALEDVEHQTAGSIAAAVESVPQQRQAVVHDAVRHRRARHGTSVPP